MSQIYNSQSAFDVLKVHFNPDVEEFWLITLDPQLKMTDLIMLSRGTLDSCPVHPRDIFRQAISRNSFGLILSHNHPSGSIWPSHADLALTKKLKKASVLLEIPILDHIIFSKDSYFSFKEKKLI